MDVYVDKAKRPWIIDFNVLGGDTDPLLFSWPEILASAAGCAVGSEQAPMASHAEHTRDSATSGVGAVGGSDESKEVTVESSPGTLELPVFRVVESEKGVMFSAVAHHALPQDMLDMDLSSPAGMEKLAELVKAQQVDTDA